MSPDPDFHSAADAWLDATASQGERRILQEILHTSPAAAQEFAALARTDALLEMALLNREGRIRRAECLITPGKTTRLKRALRQSPLKWTAAALLILIPPIWLCLPKPNASMIPTAPKNTQNTSTTARLPTGTAIPELENVPPADAAYGKFMDSFLIPEFHAEDLTLQEAIDLLTEKVTSLESATFQVRMEALPAERQQDRVHMNLKYQPASTLLQLIALQTGMKVHPTGQSYVLRPGPAYDRLDLKYRTVSISRWESFIQSQGLTPTPAPAPPRPSGGIIGHQSGRGFEPPTAAPASPGPADVSKALLATLGEAPNGVEPSPETETFKTHSSQKLDGMLGLILSGTHAPGTVTYEVKWLTFKSSEAAARVFSTFQSDANKKPRDGLIRFGEESMSAMLAALAEDPSVKMEISAPMLLFPGNQGTSTSSKSLSDPAADDWTGQLCRITSKPAGSKFPCEIMARSCLDTGDGKISSHELTSRSEIPLGTTQVLEGVINADGNHCLFLTARLPDSYPFGIPITGKPGFLLSPYAPGKGQVDVQGIPAGTKVKCPYTGQTFRVP